MSVCKIVEVKRKIGKNISLKVLHINFFGFLSLRLLKFQWKHNASSQYKNVEILQFKVEKTTKIST